MDITLSAEDELVRRTKEFAARHGMTLDQMIREYMKQVVDLSEMERDAEEFAAIAKRSGGASPEAFVFDREEIHRRQS